MTCTLQRSICTRELPSMSFRIRVRSSPSYPSGGIGEVESTRKNSQVSNGSFICEQTPGFLVISHLLPIAGSARGHFLCPEVAQRQAGERADWICLRSTKEGSHRRSSAGEGVEADAFFENRNTWYLWRLESSQRFRLPHTPGSCSPADSERSSA